MELCVTNNAAWVQPLSISNNQHAMTSLRLNVHRPSTVQPEVWEMALHFVTRFLKYLVSFTESLNSSPTCRVEVRTRATEDDFALDDEST